MLGGLAARWTVSSSANARGDFGRFFTLSIDMLCIAGFDGYFKRLKPCLERVLGYTLEGPHRAPFIDFVHSDDRAATIAETKKVARAVPSPFIETLPAKDGPIAGCSGTRPRMRSRN